MEEKYRIKKKAKRRDFIYYIILNIISLFLWSLLITGAMLLLTLPILSGALIIILADLHSNTLFFYCPHHMVPHGHSPGLTSFSFLFIYLFGQLFIFYFHNYF